MEPINHLQPEAETARVHTRILPNFVFPRLKINSNVNSHLSTLLFTNDSFLDRLITSFIPIHAHHFII